MGPRNRSCIHRASGPIEIKVPKRHDCTGFERNVEKETSTTTGFQEASEKWQRREKKVRRLGRRLPFRMRTPSKK
ncbi:hypothetical protein ARMGADRAFT_1018946 [Armillaria gallica]|uniref:Uncharacterized protein n=1 Tax=Armillaria gallica TaxID=47427 RepID=A0A2H3CL13_ARMGA|nr:hypothetical protein ARMGADRAFT_1018946 [Armillaria gallica]